MKTKKAYTAPEIELIPLDNEISLALESNPPAGPDEGIRMIQPINGSPFKNETHA